MTVSRLRCFSPCEAAHKGFVSKCPQTLFLSAKSSPKQYLLRVGCLRLSGRVVQLIRSRHRPKQYLVHTSTDFAIFWRFELKNTPPHTLRGSAGSNFNSRQSTQQILPLLKLLAKIRPVKSPFRTLYYSRV